MRCFAQRCEDVCVECIDKEDLVGCSSGVINFVAIER